jgi:hypothetical protein
LKTVWWLPEYTFNWDVTVTVYNYCGIITLAELTVVTAECTIGLLYLNIVFNDGRTLVIWLVPGDLDVQVFNRG